MIFYNLIGASHENGSNGMFLNTIKTITLITKIILNFFEYVIVGKFILPLE